MTLNSDTSAIYTLDNLKVLRGLNSECIDLVYLDPPFNTGKQWHNPIGEGGGKVGFSDIWGWDRVTGETLEETIARQWEEERDYAGSSVREVVEAAITAHSPQMGSYTAWMAPRLIEIHRILKQSGSIYVHCDDVASHYLKALLDAVFGSKSFKNDITWRHGGGGRGAKVKAKHFPRNHQNLLYYAKDTRAHLHNRIDVDIEHDAGALPPHIRKDERGYYKTAPRGDYTDESIRQLREQGRIYETSTGQIRIRYNLESCDGIVFEPAIAGSVWDIPDMMHAPKVEKQGYPTQKPLPLLERIVSASTNPGDVVLDPFCGCATACVAAQKLDRRWIGIDVEAEAVRLCRARLVNELGFDGITKEFTAPPERNDVRQLELIPRNRALRLDLWRQMQATHETDNPPCEGCGRAPGLDYMEVDHIIPRSRGGEHTWDNVQLLCGPCNRSKGNKTWGAWLRERKLQEA